MKIGFFLGGMFSNGGIGRVTSILCNQLVKDPSMEITSIFYAGSDNPLLYELNLRVKRENLFPRVIPMKNAFVNRGVKRLRDLVLANDLDVLVACGSLFYPLAILACKKTRVKCVCWEHTAPNITTDHAFQMQSRIFGARRSAANVLITRAAKEEYDNKIARKGNNLTIYNPIDEKAVAAAREYNKASHKIISVGRLTYQKNYEQLLSVANKVLSKHSDWAWDIYGEGEQRDQLTEIINGYGMEKRITLKGQVSDIYDRYGDYSFMVLLSLYEGFPMTLLEASANGLPMVSFDVKTGPNEIIDHGENGYLLPFGDEDAAANAIEALIMSEEKRVAMSVASKQSAERFKLNEIAAQWNDLFNSLK